MNRLSVLGALVAVGGRSPTMSFSPDGLRWSKMIMPLIYKEEYQWNRTIAKWVLQCSLKNTYDDQCTCMCVRLGFSGLSITCF